MGACLAITLPLEIVLGARVYRRPRRVLRVLVPVVALFVAWDALAIARALAMKPKIMLFDEPTSALDPEMINEVLEVMTDLARDGMTMIVVTHEMGFARRVADRVVFMDQGQVIEANPPEKFFAAAESPRARQFLSKILSH